MTELELVYAYLDARLKEAEAESIALRERVRTLTDIRAQVRQAIDREGMAATGDSR